MFWYFSLNPILIAAAIIPAAALMIFVYRADRLEKESLVQLASLLVSGVIATALAKVTERAGDFVLRLALPGNIEAYNFLMYFGVVAFSEEGFKYLLLKRRTWRSAGFNCQFDAVVYAAFVSLGFALWENIAYVLMYGFGTALLRAVTAVPGHACFGVFMGAFYGMARRYANEGRESASKRCRVLAVVCPALLHGAYDYIASGSMQSEWMFIAFVAALFAAAFVMTRRLSATDRYIH